MKTQSKFWPILLVLFVSGLASCRKNSDSPSTGGPVTHEDVNKWVVDSMRRYYYWNGYIPANSNLNFQQRPEVFFESILYRAADRFSWIQNREELEKALSGVIKTSGLGLSFFKIGATNAGAAVKFVHEGSPAHKAGIVRGDIFIKVNGQAFEVIDRHVTNVAPIYGNETFTLTRGVLSGNVFSPGNDVTLTPVENFQERAIHLDTVLITPNGTKVGYLFYNRFLQGQASDLIAAFTRFKSASVTDLIIDERYNSGGSIGVAAILSGLIHKNFDPTGEFIKYEFNSNFRDAILTYRELIGPDNVNAVLANNLGLQRVFLLATSESASASELLINNLRPFLGDANVIHIGDTTAGKDDASITISNGSPRFKQNKAHDWAIQPIVLKYFNRDGVGNFQSGLAPRYLVHETIPFAPMGSNQDPLIAKALSLIDPSTQAMFNKMMSIQRTQKSIRAFDPLVEFNKNLSDAYPLDVTESLERKGMLKTH